MRALILLLFLLFAVSIHGQGFKERLFFGLYNSTVDDIAEQLPDYNFYRTSDGKLVKNSDGKFDMVRKISQYAFNFNNDFQFYVQRRNINEKLIFDNNKLFAVIYQRKRTNLL